MSAARQEALAAVRAMARECADKRLALRDARALFDAVYMAAQRAGSCMEDAAARAGVQRTTLARIRRRAAAGMPEWD